MTHVNVNKITHKKWTDGCTERVNRLRDKYWEHTPEIDTERARVYTEVYKDCEADELIVKRAKALYRYIAEKTLTIDSDELIIGTEGKKHRSAVVCPDLSWSWIEEELDTMSTRSQDPYAVSEEEKKILREEIFPYWKGKSAEDYALANMPEDLKKVGIGTNIIFADLKFQSGVGEFAAGYHNLILKKGFKGIQNEAKEYLSKLDIRNPQNYEKIKFYEAIIICCDATKLLSERYANYARELASYEANKKRKAELLKIADNAERVPYNPPENFYQAVQAVWFTQILLWAEENAPANCIGRPDQYLYPFYKKEIEEGTITELEAQEILECLWIKMAEPIFIISEESAAFYSGYQSYHGLTIGGIDEKGNDAVNPLSYMMLKCTEDLRLHLPTINVRINEKTSDDYLMKICDLVKVGTGQPAIFFDETAISLLMKRGIPEEDARGWCVGGCVEPNVPGKTNMWAESCRYSHATAIEWVLFNGYSKMLNQDMGLKTGDPREFKTFREFEDAVKKQLAYLIELSVRASHIAEKAHQSRLPKPIKSMCIEGCMENGVDCMYGGALYNNGPGIETTGIADLADSIVAVKKLVYDEKLISMEELIDALDKDFEGHENIRQILIHGAPKFGNDNDEVDQFAADFAEYSCDASASYNSTNGSCFVTGPVPVIANIPHGQSIWALPSGRKAGEALADGMSPHSGCDVNGPTAVIKSVCKVDHTKNGCGVLLNMKLNPDMLETEEGKKNFISLLKAERDLGGYHVQFNVVSSDTLKKAKSEPEKYSDLLVRVAGYSAFFVELRPEAQDAIIARTENSQW